MIEIPKKYTIEQLDELIALAEKRKEAIRFEYPKRLLVNVIKESEICLDEDHLAGLEKALSMLPEKERRILKLYYEEGKTLAEIAALDGHSQPYISEIKRRAIWHLKEPHKLKYILNGLAGSGIVVGNMNTSEDFRQLELPARYNTPFLRSSCHTIQDVISIFESGKIDKLRLIGEKGLEEIREAVARKCSIFLYPSDSGTGYQAVDLSGI